MCNTDCTVIDEEAAATTADNNYVDTYTHARSECD